MKVILLLGLCLHLIYVSEGKIFRRCEIVKIANEQLDGYAGASAADWTCLMEHESDYNSALIQDNQAQSRDYGIFQINSKYWCDDGRIDTANRCNIKCWKFLDNYLEDDIECAKKIATHANGLSPWNSWVNQCEGHDLTNYMDGC